MKLIVQGPSAPQDRAELLRRVAGIHAEAVLTYMGRQPLPPGEKRALLEQLLGAQDGSGAGAGGAAPL